MCSFSFSFFLFSVHLIWLFQSASSDLSPLPVPVNCGGGLGGAPTVVVCLSGSGFSCHTRGDFPLQRWLCSNLSVLLRPLFVVFSVAGEGEDIIFGCLCC